jgi:ApaG protein
MKLSSECITDGIKVQVYPAYSHENSEPENNKYLFSYTITIENLSNKPVRLISRHWHIIDSEGETEQVKGTGVVGYQPKLFPGESFTYTSYCPLRTPWGTMEGNYTMIDEDGNKFKVNINRFYLISPYTTETA